MAFPNITYVPRFKIPAPKPVHIYIGSSDKYDVYVLEYETKPSGFCLRTRTDSIHVGKYGHLRNVTYSQYKSSMDLYRLMHHVAMWLLKVY